LSIRRKDCGTLKFSYIIWSLSLHTDRLYAAAPPNVPENDKHPQNNIFLKIDFV
jgi:hypothetical protein